MSSSQIEYAIQQTKDYDLNRLQNQRLEIELIISGLLTDRGGVVATTDKALSKQQGN